MEEIEIQLVANAGLMIRFRDTTILMDGIYGKNGHPFSVPDEETYQKMASGEPPFEKLDYLIFSHAHPDHFSPKRTIEFLRKRRVKGVFMPDDPFVEEQGLPQFLRDEGIPFVQTNKKTDRTSYRIEPGVTVKAFHVRHLDKKFENVPHFCYILTLGDQKFLFTSDADYVNESFDMLDGQHFTRVFMNPLFFGVLRRGKYFKGHFDTDGYCVYHVPFSPDDGMGMRLILAKEWLNWPVNGSARVEVLCDAGQKVIY